MTEHASIEIGRAKRVALVAHDNRKPDLMDWARFNRGRLQRHTLYATGTTGRLLADELGFDVRAMESGPLGGDLQLGAMIAGGEIDVLIFFWDPLESLPHDPDVKALLRIAAVWNVPVACNRATADFLFSSPLMSERYRRQIPDFDTYRARRLAAGIPPEALEVPGEEEN
jgi:methylglyoxal synthase